MNICVKEKDSSVTWEEITELLHKAYKRRKEEGLLYAATYQSVEETINRANPINALKKNTLIIFLNDKLVGTVSYSIFRENEWYKGEKTLKFCMFAVHPDYQRQGIGDSILSELDNIALKESCDSIVMDTSEKAKSLVKWYCKHDFFKVDCLSHPNTNYYSTVFVKPTNIDISKKFLLKIYMYYYFRKSVIHLKFRENGEQRIIVSSLFKLFNIRFLLYTVLIVITRMFSCFVPYKRILLISNGVQMDAHIIDFYKVVKQFKNIKWYLLQTNHKSKELSDFAVHNSIIQINSVCYINKIFGIHFHGIVTADGIKWALGEIKQFPHPKKMYINHGYHIVGKNGGQETYAYYDLLKYDFFDIMLEPNKRIEETIKKKIPSLKDVVYWVGWKFSEYELLELEKRDAHRASLRIKNNDIMVFIASTYGPYSLFHSLGDDLFSEILKLSDRFTFVLSAHPIEYLSQDGVGQKIEKMKQYGIRIRNCEEDWLPYMAAADIVISDYSTLTEAAIRMRKKTILSDYPPEIIWNESFLYKIKKYLPVLNFANELQEKLETIVDFDYPDTEEFNDLLMETYIKREEYECIVRNLFIKTFLTKDQLPI